MRILETKKIRQTMGLNQKEFAEALGLSRMSITNWETGRSEPSPDTIKKLIAFCKENKIRITR